MRNAKQSVLNLAKLFPIGGDGLARYLSTITLPAGFHDRSGHRVQVFIDTANGRRLDTTEPVEHSDGNTRLSVYFLKNFVLGRSVGAHQAVVRIDVPWAFADGHAALERYTLYNIRFSLPKGEVPDNMVGPLFAGYFGVTKRHPFERFSEHQRDMRSGGGYALLAKVEGASGKTGPCAHYRKGHLRKLADKSVWVSPCWVALKEIAA